MLLTSTPADLPQASSLGKRENQTVAEGYSLCCKFSGYLMSDAPSFFFSLLERTFGTWEGLYMYFSIVAYPFDPGKKLT